MKDAYKTNYRIGEDNLQKWGLDIHHPVFWISALSILGFIILTLLSPITAKKVFDSSKAFSIQNFDWLFLYVTNFLVLFCLVLIVSPYGKIRLGGNHQKPDFSLLSWFSMLFAAGMGIGLMFWSVAEPVGYYTDWFGTPLGVEARTEAGRKLALGTALFHWGLHPWAIYAVVGLSLAFFSFNKKLPLSIRSGFYPLIGEKTWGWMGHTVDVVAVLATIFGLATSLGFGAKQAAGGMEYVFGINNDLSLQIIVICGITLIAILSVVRGLEGGVKILSNANMILALMLFLFVLLLGPTVGILKDVVTTLRSYGNHVFELSSFNDRSDETFLHSWTVFYWAWWISWSPFVGMFIARISRGRTIREFLMAVLIVPVLVTTIWMATFGGTALEQVVAAEGPLADGVTKVELAMFQMLENLPLKSITAFIATIVVLLFFVTSSDSGSLVIDSITSGGKLDAPIPQRIFWASMEGCIAIALLVGGGADALGALQAGAISVGLPFSIVLLILAFSLVLGLRHEWKYAEISHQKPLSNQKESFCCHHFQKNRKD